MTEAHVDRSAVVIIEAGRGSTQYWRDLWRYRELFYFLAWRDILVRYKQTVAGVAWAWIRPVAATVMATLVFGHIAGLPSNGVPYPVMVLAGLLPWQLFANTLADAGNSLVSNSNLIVKVYFPRLIVPASTAVIAAIDSLIASVLLAALMAWYGVAPTWRLAAVPVFAALALAAAFGAGLWLSALTVRYRDVRFVVPFIVQFGFFATPVAYSTAAVPARWQALYRLNPLVGVIDGFRWALLGGVEPLQPATELASLVVIAGCVAGGIAYFRRTERTFADVI